MIWIEILFLLLNIGILYLNYKIYKKKSPKWEYYKEGIRFFNKNGDPTIEHDKPLMK